MVDVDFAFVEVVVTVVGFVATAFLAGIYTRLRGWVKRFEALEKRVSILDLNTKILIRVMGELNPGFAKAWNRYAAVYKTTLIDERGATDPPTDQGSFEDTLQDVLRDEMRRPGQGKA